LNDIKGITKGGEEDMGRQKDNRSRVVGGTGWVNFWGRASRRRNSTNNNKIEQQVRMIEG